MPFLRNQTQRLSIDWMDNEGQVATTTFHLPLSLSVNQVISAANSLISVISHISNAKVKAWDCRNYWRQTDNEEPDTASDVTVFLGLYYRNSDRSDGYYVPSPKETLFVSGGAYDGILLDSGNDTVTDIVEQFTQAITITRTQNDEEWPLPFIVGGLVR